MNVFVKIGIVIVTGFLMAQGIYLLINKGRNDYFYHTTAHFTELLENSTNYDLLLLGSSRTHLHDNPRIIDSVTGMNSYNAGIEGGSMMELDIVLNGYLETHPAPKLVVLEVAMLSMDVDKQIVSNPTFYFNHLQNNAVYNRLNQSWKYTGFLKYLPFLRLAQFDDLNRSYGIKGLIGEKEPLFGDTYKGYAENTSQVISDTVTSNATGCAWVKYSEKGNQFLSQVLSSCQKKKIPIIVMYAPEYKRMNYECPDGHRVIAGIDSICRSFNIPFWNYLNNPICNNRLLFANISHFNKRGADVFSAMLAEDIRKYAAGIKTDR